MDFFAGQDEARRKTSRLVVYFGLAVCFIILAIYFVLTFLFVARQGGGPARLSPWMLWDPELFIAVTGITLLVVFLGSLYKISALRSGGARVAEMLGGRLIPAATGNFLEKRLLNIVEEMSIASGVPVPPVYLMEREKGINAFAAGFSPDDAVIGVTEGALATLDREELQGVIAHEYSHILNGDMRLDLKLVGILHGILLIAFIGRSILRGSSRSRNNKNSGGAVLFGLALLIIGYIGVVFGKLIKSAVSRQREYLADASAVQFTRNPLGLAGALKKIGGLAAGSLVDHARAEEISHMFFSNGLSESWLGAFSTHPPLAERILKLDPAFDGVYPEVSRTQVLAGESAKRPKAGLGESKPAGKVFMGAVLPVLTVLGGKPENITRDIGAPLREYMEYARRLLDSLPEQVRETAANPFGARAVIYGLLIDQDASIRARQMEFLQNRADNTVFQAVGKILPDMLTLNEESRLPLMDLAMPSLRSLSLEQFRRFEENINSLIRIDKRISLFEFTLQHVVVRRLEKNFVTPLHGIREIGSIGEAAREASLILSLLANLGHESADSARLAFSGAVEIFGRQGTPMTYLTVQESRDVNLPDILDRLADLNPKIKRTLITACFQSLVHDGRITMREAEFFRLLVYSLDTPLPPWIKV